MQIAKPNHTTYHFLGSILVVFLLLAVSLLLVNTISQNELAARLVADFGYVGVVFLAVIAGINTLIPLPAATFVPVFVAGGLSLPLVIIALVLGTIIADFTSYIIGHWSQGIVSKQYPKIFAYVAKLNKTKHRLILPLVLIYAAIVPFPNEAIIIPLGMAGVRFSHLLIPLLLGNIIHQTLLSYGINNIFSLVI